MDERVNAGAEADTEVLIIVVYFCLLSVAHIPG